MHIDVRNPNLAEQGLWFYTLEIESADSIAGISDTAFRQHLPFDESLSYDYRLYNNDTVAHQVLFRFTPTIVPFDGGDPCVNSEGVIEKVLIVYPTPEIRVKAIPDTVICNDQYITLEVRNPNHLLLGGEWMYDLIVTDTSGFITGVNQDSLVIPEGGLYTYIEDFLHNSDTSAHSVTYNFIPMIRSSDDGQVCRNAETISVTVWVNPTPRLYISFEDSVLCNNETLEIVVEDGMGIVKGGKKRYRVIANYNSSFVEY